MKNPFLAAAFCLFMTGISWSAKSQEVIRLQSCNDLSIQKQADSMKTLLQSKGFELVKEVSITMESEYEMPVIVPLTEQNWYQFIFIGDISSRLYEVRMYDWDERQVIYQKKMWGDVDGNIISYTYKPAFSEYHMIKPLQVNKKKKKGLCGYFIMMKKVR
jgi:hypothetical protein